MKFKKGFTLAEVLVTLGIIGVISALTLPTFTASTANAEIGPKLGKFVASFEEATHTYLNTSGYSRLSQIPQNGELKEVAIINALRGYLHIEKIEQRQYLTKDGMSFGFSYDPQNPVGDFANSTLPQDHYIGRITLWINDPRNIERKNKQGRDIFSFALYDDGSLVPVGSKNWAKWKQGGGNSWQTECPNKPATVGASPITGSSFDDHAYTCAGSIFEQGMKVNYRLAN